MVDISIVGAAGEVGRALATHLLRGELIGPSERLQLVGHGREASERKLLAERCDLLDAFDETAPSIQIAATLEEVAGDIIVLAAGATISGSGADRRELAAANRPLFEAFGAALARAGTGQELVIVVTNPAGPACPRNTINCRPQRLSMTSRTSCKRLVRSKLVLRLRFEIAGSMALVQLA